MNTDKQPQTVYIPTPQENSFDDLEVVHVKTGIIVDKVHEKELLCFTLEELEALLQKEREADQWISVKDRLPHIDTYVQVCTLNKLFSPISNIITKYSRYGFESASGVTHWMPLPEPPSNEDI